MNHKRFIRFNNFLDRLLGGREMKLYGYWRSLASFRVRIALNLKGLESEHAYLDLAKGDQFADGYRAINPQMVIPTLDDGGEPLFQSLAIVEYLDEIRPEPPLLPGDPKARARVRGLAQIACCDSHPLIVPRIRKYLTDVLSVGEPDRLTWIQKWLTEGTRAIEANLASSAATGTFCHGDRPTLADVCLVPQIVGCQLFACVMDDYPISMGIFETCMALDAFRDAHPTRQPDYTPEG